ncbi:MAG: TrbC/VirB2 family protein [Pseudomonadota bacterium]
MKMRLNVWKEFLSVFVLLMFVATASATTTGLPWEGPMNTILESITGPVAQFLGVIAIVISGFGIAFGEAGSGMRRLFQVVLGLSIAFTAASLLSKLFGVSGGVMF